ncbi:MAG: hypothetical protein AAGC95_17780 [Pseudomonadota bacterium]
MGTAYHAVVGGIGAELGGGKFKDGAATGAFVYLFNEAIISNSLINKKRREATDVISDYLEDADVSQGSPEDGAASLLNLRTGKLRHLFGEAAGRGTNGEFNYRIRRQSVDEILVAIGHSHPKSDTGDRRTDRIIDRANEGLNRADRRLRGIDSDRDPTGKGSTFILKTPSGRIKEFKG